MSRVGELRPEVKAAWVEALRSGEYHQGKTWLRQREDGQEKFCCLGVLCEIAAGAGVTVRTGYLDDDASIFDYDREDSYPPPPVIRWAYKDQPDDGLEWYVGGDGGPQALSGLNDVTGLSFAEIADRIEASL